MNYRTSYFLTEYLTLDDAIHEDECGQAAWPETKKAAKDLVNIAGIWSDEEFEYYADHENALDLVSSDTICWADHVNDMLKLSKLHPDKWFVLEGHGEDWDDVWRELYHNGDYEHKKW